MSDRAKTPDLDTDILRAAEILEREARLIRDSNSVGKRLWQGDCEKDHADHDEMLRIARRLKRTVGKL